MPRRPSAAFQTSMDAPTGAAISAPHASPRATETMITLSSGDGELQVSLPLSSVVQCGLIARILKSSQFSEARSGSVRFSGLTGAILKQVVDFLLAVRDGKRFTPPLPCVAELLMAGSYLDLPALLRCCASVIAERLPLLPCFGSIPDAELGMILRRCDIASLCRAEAMLAAERRWFDMRPLWSRAFRHRFPGQPLPDGSELRSRLIAASLERSLARFAGSSADERELPEDGGLSLLGKLKLMGADVAGEFTLRNSLLSSRQLATVIAQLPNAAKLTLSSTGLNAVDMHALSKALHAQSRQITGLDISHAGLTAAGAGHLASALLSATAASAAAAAAASSSPRPLYVSKRRSSKARRVKRRAAAAAKAAAAAAAGETVQPSRPPKSFGRRKFHRRRRRQPRRAASSSSSDSAGDSSGSSAVCVSSGHHDAKADAARLPALASSGAASAAMLPARRLPSSASRGMLPVLLPGISPARRRMLGRDGGGTGSAASSCSSFDGDGVRQLAKSVSQAKLKGAHMLMRATPPPRKPRADTAATTAAAVAAADVERRLRKD
eukprot:PLAT3339.62.p1 GENE.PLAT3339.62~~PLAT3339.62.p1  ORF type:complete len:554 (+),score=223.70 PLAT3339.62:909-2570(+)